MKKIVIFMVGFLLMTVNLYAADGDFIVDGNLGVGTTSPRNKLDVLGGIIAQGDGGNQISIRTSSRRWDFDVDTGAGDILRIRDMTSGTVPLSIDTSGNVGIGTTDPGEMLHINGRLRVYNTQIWDNEINRYTNDPLHIGYRNTSMTTIQGNGGNVAIGTTDPQGYKLYVDGNVKVAGDVWANSGNPLSSDIKFKKNVQPIESALSKIIKMNGVVYNWKTEEFKSKGFSEGKHYGVIAQEMEKVLPEIVRNDPNGDKAVVYTEIIPVLIESIKEQQKEITALKAEQQAMKEQHAMISALFEKVNALERQVQMKGTVALVEY